MLVAFKLEIFNVEFVDKLFKFVKIVNDVLFKLEIFNVVFVDRLFKFVLILDKLVLLLLM